MDEGRQREGGVQSIDRAMMLMEILASDGDGFRLVDIAFQARLSPSTTHRLLTTLQRRRFAECGKDGLWRVGRTSFAVGSAYLDNRTHLISALDVLRRLRDNSRASANIGIADGSSVLLLNRLASRIRPKYVSPVGEAVPMVNSAMGKAILATLPNIDVEEIVSDCGMRRYTAKSITRFSLLRSELQQVKTRGYAVDDEEYCNGIICVAAPIYDRNRDALYAISVSGTTEHFGPDKIANIGALVTAAAAEAERAIFPRV